MMGVCAFGLLKKNNNLKEMQYICGKSVIFA